MIEKNSKDLPYKASSNGNGNPNGNDSSNGNGKITLTKTGMAPEAQAFILTAFNRQQDNRVVYHNFQFTARVVKLVEQIGRNSETPAEAIDIAATAAWFCSIGYHKDYRNPLEKSIELAEKFLYGRHFNNVLILQVLRALENLQTGSRMELAENAILNDAIQAAQFGKDYFDESRLMRAELQAFGEESEQSSYKNDVTWNAYQIKSLEGARFYTSFAKLNYEPLATQNLLKLKERIQAVERSAVVMTQEVNGSGNIAEAISAPLVRNPASAPFSNPPKGGARNASQTFYRTGFANHMHLSQIADNKAHLLISVNSILLSVLISGLTYKNLSQTHPMVLLPATVFILAGLTSLVFAMLSVRPKVTSVITDMPEEEQKKAIAFFGNFTRLSYQHYERYMDEVVRSQQLLYANMTRDMYYLGKVLDKKYRFLTYSYDIFMIGFVSSVILFLATILKDSL